MKQLLLPSLIGLAGIGFIVLGFYTNVKPDNSPSVISLKSPVDVEYFKKGDTLLPDAVCGDTLIVIDAEGLNKAWALYEQGLVETADYQLDSIMHSNCRELNDRRLTSVIYVEGKDTMALDYLTLTEYNNLLK